MNTSTDGRVARRQKNRAATLNAVLDLFALGATDPTVEDISDESGVSTRSIYRYFHHREHLLLAALGHLRDRLEPQLALQPDMTQPLADRIAQFAEHRLALHQALAPLTRASRRAVAAGDDESAEPAVDSSHSDSPETHLRKELQAQFAPELERRDAADREVQLAALGLGFGFEGVEHLERTLETNGDVTAVFVRHLTAHLADSANQAVHVSAGPSVESRAEPT